MKANREALDEALANMFAASSQYSSSYLFYAHMISQCSIIIDDKLTAPAGVAFNIDHYDLYINDSEFGKYTLIQRLGVLKHEMLHILHNHITRTEDRVHTPFNFSTDCAINQQIERTHLPAYTQEDIDKIDPSIVIEKGIKVGDCVGIYPDNFPVKDKSKVKPKMHAEFYYDLLKDEAENQEDDQDCDQCGGSGEQEDEDGETHSCDNCSGSGKTPGNGYSNSPGKLVDDHETWNKSKGDKDMQKDLTKRMIEHSISETSKSRGELPQDISDMLSLFTRKSQVDWKKVLRKIVGNKKVGKRPTIMRKSRRFPGRADLKGNTKDRAFTLVVGVDISGSMSTEEILLGLGEIHHICKLTKTKMKLIQIDTEVHAIQDFDDKTKLFERQGCGGTYMGDCPKYIKDNKIECDALVMISDMGIENVPADPIWNAWKKRTIWLSTDIMPDWSGWNKHTILPLKAQ